MAPNLTGPATGLFLAEAEVLPTKKSQSIKSETRPVQSQSKEKQYVYKVQLVWRNVIAFLLFHAGCLYGFYLVFTGQAMLKTFLFSLAYGWMAGTGITGGAHRLWAHKAYKARWPLRLLLCLWQTAAFQNHIYEWVRDHRVHHKFCDTNADPHNSKRGFFFSHMGWLMVRKHKDVIEKGKTIDMSDLEKDWVVMFQKRHYLWLMPVFCFVIPSMIPWYFWGEDGWTSYWVAGIMRWTLSLNFTWLVNSAAHMWGDKPYDRSISGAENLFVGITALGEGWHNYHHAFPWDYKASELWNVNSTTKFINLMAMIGWAYNLKEASEELILKRIERTGKVSAMSKENIHEGELWGWDDKDMTNEEKCMATIKSHKVE